VELRETPRRSRRLAGWWFSSNFCGESAEEAFDEIDVVILGLILIGPRIAAWFFA
jgi:hypothetical protein